MMRDVFAKDIYGKAGFEFGAMTLIAYEYDFFIRIQLQLVCVHPVLD